MVAEGLTQEVISRLAQIQGWTIRSLASSTLKGEGRNLVLVGRQNDADFVLDASVVVSNGRLRLNTRLIDLDNERAEWEDTFGRNDGDVFATIDDLVRSLASHLRLEVGGGQRRYRTDPELELLFLKARALQLRRHRDPVLEAVALFDQIVGRDPGYAPAVAARARSLGDVWRLGRESEPGAVSPMLEEAALEAIRLDPLLPDAQAALGTLYTRNGQWTNAEEAFKRALDIDPSQGSLYVDYVMALLFPLERVDDALEVLAKARDVAPLSLDVYSALTIMQIQAGLYQEAIANAKWVLGQAPDFPFVDAQLGRALYLSGRPDEALPIFLSKQEHQVFLGYLYAITGRRDEAEALAAGFPPARQFWIYGGLGDKERAFEALDRAVTIQPWRVATWMIRPEMKILRGDPRFQAIRRRLGLPD
jgi:TolB-like protein/Flp pilus assembly protein TadD